METMTVNKVFNYAKKLKPKDRTKLIVKLSQAQPAEIHERTKKKTASSENLDKELSAGYKSVAKESKKISRQFLTADLENWNEY